MVILLGQLVVEVDYAGAKAGSCIFFDIDGVLGSSKFFLLENAIKTVKKRI